MIATMQLMRPSNGQNTSCAVDCMFMNSTMSYVTLHHYSTCVLLQHCPLHDHLTPTTGCGKCWAISCGKFVWNGKVTCLWSTCKIIAILSSVCIPVYIYIYSLCILGQCSSLLIPKWSVSDMGLGLSIELTLKL